MATTSDNGSAGANSVEALGRSRQQGTSEKKPAQRAVTPKNTELDQRAAVTGTAVQPNYVENPAARDKKAAAREEKEPVGTAQKPMRDASPAATVQLASAEITKLLQEERKQELLKRLNDRYVQQGAEYRFRGDPSKVAFRDEGKRISTDLDHPSVARSIVDAAETKGWAALRVHGTDEFKRVVWIEATVRGVKAIGYDPSQKDREAVEAERLARSQNRVEPRTPSQQPGRSVDPSGGHKAASERTAAEPKATGRTSGTLVEHGPAPYRFDAQESPNYYVKLISRGQEKLVWGKQLGEAVQAAGAKVGDRVSLQLTGAKPVTVEKNVRDDSGKVIGREEGAALRNEWSVKVLGRTAVAKVLDGVVAKQPDLSPEARARVVAEGVKRNAQLEAAGTPKVVKIYDPAAERAVPRPVRQLEPSRERTARTR